MYTTCLNSSLGQTYETISNSFQQSLFDLADNCNIIYSDTSGDVVDIGGRKAKRESSEPCLWLIATESLKYYGWMCIGLSKDAVNLTSQTTYGDSSVRTCMGSGYTYYVATMNNRMTAGNDMKLISDSKTHIIPTSNAILYDTTVTLKELSAYAAKIKDFATNAALGMQMYVIDDDSYYNKSIRDIILEMPNRSEYLMPYMKCSDKTAIQNLGFSQYSTIRITKESEWMIVIMIFGMHGSPIGFWEGNKNTTDIVSELKVLKL